MAAAGNDQKRMKIMIGVLALLAAVFVFRTVAGGGGGGGSSSPPPTATTVPAVVGSETAATGATGDATTGATEEVVEQPYVESPRDPFAPFG